MTWTVISIGMRSYAVDTFRDYEPALAKYDSVKDALCVYLYGNALLRASRNILSDRTKSAFLGVKDSEGPRPMSNSDVIDTTTTGPRGADD